MRRGQDGRMSFLRRVAFDQLIGHLRIMLEDFCSLGLLM